MYRPQFIDTDWPQSITKLQEEIHHLILLFICGHRPHCRHNYVKKKLLSFLILLDVYAPDRLLTKIACLDFLSAFARHIRYAALTYR
jgi:hypothetical protein